MLGVRLEGRFLRSKVARRTFALFIVSALVPIMLIGALSFAEVSRLVEKQSREHLLYSGQTYGAAVYERLLRLDERLGGLAASLSVDPQRTASTLRLPPNLFSALSVDDGTGQPVVASGRKIVIPSLGPDSEKHLAQAKTVLLVVRVPRASPELLMIRAIDPKQPNRGRLIATINPGYLWGDSADFPYQTAFCVLEGSDAPLFCSTPLAESATSEIATAGVASASGAIRWRADNEDHLAAYWNLFLLPKFHAPNWLIVASQPEAQAMAGNSSFRGNLIPIIVFSILAVALLSATQIRRMLVPLEKLIAGTRRIANGDFNTSVDVDQPDEFGALGSSFNAMALRLRRQFGMLTTQSEIDRIILSKLDIDQVVEIVLGRIRDILPVDVAGLALLDRESPEEARIYFRDCRSLAPLEIERLTLTPHDSQLLNECPQGVWFNKRGTSMWPASAAQAGQGRLFVLPILSKAQPLGFIGLGCKEQVQPDQATVIELRSLADRIAVALSSAARDEELYYQARFDLLTGLPNRLMFKDRLSQEIGRASRAGSQLALLFIDLDRFKTVNDTLGHSLGDYLLQQAATRLKIAVREVDMVARLGGDEFTVILSGIKAKRDIDHVADELIRTLSQSFVLEGHERFISASIGISVYPDDGTTDEDLLKYADTAMYRAKESGRNRYIYFEERMNIESAARVAVETELRRALEQREFVLHYQPQVNVRTEQVVGAEALVRWEHPSRGLLAPIEFIAIAEESGLIHPLGQWVLETACKQLRSWQVHGIAPARIAVNVSSHQLMHPGFVQLVKETIAAAGISPRCLELEVTESVFMHAEGDAAAALGRLHALGVVIALDDFGTGYSSLTYLRHLPIDVLKIDQSFTMAIQKNEDSNGIVTAIVSMAHHLRKQVTAEGVESQAQLDFLRSHGCDTAQGFYLSVPLASDAFAQFIASRQVVAA
jgi:diguanylate cyclase (GGDEF)-like protein